MQKHPLILTLRLDALSLAFFDAQRKLYFPPERNFLDAHLMLFHQLPYEPATFDHFSDLSVAPFNMQVTGLMNLGAGVAYRIDSPDLRSLHRSLSSHFRDRLTPQDKQGFRPHITIMNKTTPEIARALIADLTLNFKSFTIQATGLDLWTYLNGPWRHERIFLF